MHFLPIARGRSGNWRLLSEAAMRTAHTVSPTRISRANVAESIFNTRLNRLRIRNKLKVHDFFLTEAAAVKEVAGKG